ncbi:MAG: hypothetical protein LC772_11715, partial [Chloroflexi bacterium]|nr:hypothetical protein [Chloroflexota bacterium]
MRSIHLDCSLGIDEFRLLGALLDCGASAAQVSARVLPDGAAFLAAPAESGGVTGIRVDPTSLE